MGLNPNRKPLGAPVTVMPLFHEQVNFAWCIGSAIRMVHNQAGLSMTIIPESLAQCLLELCLEHDVF